MTAADHLAQAAKYAGVADEMFLKTGEDGLSWPERMAHLETARTAAEAGRLHLDLHRELILREHFADRDDWRPAKAADLLTFPEHRTAPADPSTRPAGTVDQHHLRED